ncbi:hypothetical protein F511_11670 [Dorcoceras hygrometricum]|uniref:Uncharacterized protein n=1 Tax=Dorcoceras hygrometricum TaxID=472368 RepID=A0A2Z7A9U1_9LAMI|nr:hypothetical protein F511_11670 [Dorcoceras hygrometricum]
MSRWSTVVLTARSLMRLEERSGYLGSRICVAWDFVVVIILRAEVTMVSPLVVELIQLVVPQEVVVGGYSAPLFAVVAERIAHINMDDEPHPFDVGTVRVAPKLSMMLPHFADDCFIWPLALLPHIYCYRTCIE